MMYGYPMMAGSWLWMVVVGVFWLGMIALVIWELSRLFPLPRQASHSTNNTTAMDMLRRRYASGEMSRTEFEEARSVLE